jgi:hypothetical protein
MAVDFSKARMEVNFEAALTWKPHVGPSKVVYQGYEVIGIFPDEDGAIAVIGLARCMG